MFVIFKKSSEKIISEIQTNAFKSWGVSQNDIAAELRFKTALAVYVSTVLSVSHDDRDWINRISSGIFSKITATVEDKRCRVSDIFSIKPVNCDDFSQQKFMTKAEIDSPSVIMNGFGILDCLAQVIGSDCVAFMTGRDRSELGYAGMIWIKNLTVGKIESDDLIADAQLDFLGFATKMIKITK